MSRNQPPFEVQKATTCADVLFEDVVISSIRICDVSNPLRQKTKGSHGFSSVIVLTLVVTSTLNGLPYELASRAEETAYSSQFLYIACVREASIFRVLYVACVKGAQKCQGRAAVFRNIVMENNRRIRDASQNTVCLFKLAQKLGVCD